MDDLREPAVQDRLTAIWTDPQSLDPARRSAAITRDDRRPAGDRRRRLERKHDPKAVAEFLMPCIFTMARRRAAEARRAFFQPGVGPGLQSREVVEDQAGEIERLAPVAYASFDLARALRVARLTGIDVKAHLYGIAAIRRVGHAPSSFGRALGMVAQPASPLAIVVLTLS